VIRFRRPCLQDVWEEERRRIIRETEQFLEHHLAHPEHTVRIPAVRIGAASFPVWASHWFWDKVLYA
jgi:hypothetical protein